MIVPPVVHQASCLSLMTSMCVVSPCGVLFTQELRIHAATLHWLWQHHLHHTQPIVILLGPGLSALCWLSEEPVPFGRDESGWVLVP